ncbi:MAG TPA: hypothetical protein VI636_09795 [Candidatus Angelobacter sp.]
MPLLQLTDRQLKGIIREVVANARQRQEFYLWRATPLDPVQKDAMRLFFPSQVLDDVRVLELKSERVPNPAFQKRAKEGGFKLMLDSPIWRKLPIPG